MKKLIIFLVLFSNFLFSQDKKYILYSNKELKQGTIICRKIKNTPYYHYGLVYGTSDDKRIVLHFNQTGVHYSKIEDFSEGSPILVVRKKQIDLNSSKIKELVKIWKKTKYDASNSNCEHFAYELSTGYRISIQRDLTEKYIDDYSPMVENIMKKVRPQDSAMVKSIISYSKILIK